MAGINKWVGGAAAGAFVLLASNAAMAASVLLLDTDGDGTSVLDKTGELTGGNANVAASAAGVAFTDTAAFSVTAPSVVVSYDLTNQATAGMGSVKGVGELSGGTMEIFNAAGNVPIAASLVTIPTQSSGVVTPSTDFSGEFTLAAGNYYVKVVSSGFDAVANQGVAKYALAVQGNNAVPEPATWAVMLIGFGGVGATMRARRRSAALAA